MIIVGRPINGISLNGLEFLLDGPDGNYMKFDSKQEALEFVRENAFPGATDQELEDYFTFLEESEVENLVPVNSEQ